MENLGSGLQITLYGMGLVFALLAALWGLLSLVCRFDRHRPAEPRRRPHSAAGAGGSAPTRRHRAADLVAAITIAVLTHTGRCAARQAAPAMRSYSPGSLLYAWRWVAAGRARQNRTLAR